MTIDGKENVKERIEIFKGPDFITYKYVFENENYYNESVPTWKQTDYDHNIRILVTPEDKIERNIGSYIYRRY